MENLSLGERKKWTLVHKHIHTYIHTYIHTAGVMIMENLSLGEREEWTRLRREVKSIKKKLEEEQVLVELLLLCIWNYCYYVYRIIVIM
jgi:hypothetical protein